MEQFGLTWDKKTNGDWIVSEPLGKDGIAASIVSKYNFGYQIKLAKYTGKDFKPGLYVMTKYCQDQMPDHLPDEYITHFYFDQVQITKQDEKYVYPDPSRELDDKNKHLAPISGYWLQRMDTKKGYDFRVTAEYDQMFAESSSARISNTKDFVVTYIPYNELNYTEEGVKHIFNESSTFGFACNLHYTYTGGEWHNWQGTANPTGYGITPNYESLTSYIQFDKDLKVISYYRPA